MGTWLQLPAVAWDYPPTFSYENIHMYVLLSNNHEFNIKPPNKLAYMFNALFLVYRVNISVADVVYLTLYNFRYREKVISWGLAADCTD